MKKSFSLFKFVLIVLLTLLGSILIVDWIQENTKLSRKVLDVNRNSALLATWIPGSPIAALTVDRDLVYYIRDMDILTSRNMNTSAVNWTKNIGFGGARAIEIYQNRILILTVLDLISYDTTGQRLWTTHLGVGHVETILEMEANSVRIYYGDTIFFINPLSGEIEAKIPRNNVLWENTNIQILENHSDKGMTGIEKLNNLVLWEKPDETIRDDWYFFPEVVNKSELVVRTTNLGICLLKIESGVYSWCRTEIYLSNTAVDTANNSLYAIRDDFTLVKLDLQTGNVVGEVHFTPSKLSEKLSHYGFDYFVRISSDKVIVYFGDSDQVFVLQKLR
jgi:hypothetical protein